MSVGTQDDEGNVRPGFCVDFSLHSRTLKRRTGRAAGTSSSGPLATLPACAQGRLVPEGVFDNLFTPLRRWR